MVLNPDGARPDSEAAAHRRWLITVAITILFGTFGAVMTYLTYARGSKPWSSSRAPISAPVTAPIIAPTAPPTEGPPTEAPTNTADDGDKHDKEK